MGSPVPECRNNPVFSLFNGSGNRSAAEAGVEGLGLLNACVVLRRQDPDDAAGEKDDTIVDKNGGADARKLVDGVCGDVGKEVGVANTSLSWCWFL